MINLKKLRLVENLTQQESSDLEYLRRAGFIIKSKLDSTGHLYGLDVKLPLWAVEITNPRKIEKYMNRRPIEYVYGHLWGDKFHQFSQITPEFGYMEQDSSNTGVNYREVTLKILTKLHALGFGAIPCAESPTGWVDLYGRFCALKED